MGVTSEKPYTWRSLPGRLFVRDAAGTREAAYHVDRAARRVLISGVVAPHLVASTVRLALGRLPAETPEPVIILQPGACRVPPPGWRWVSGCFLCRMLPV